MVEIPFLRRLGGTANTPSTFGGWKKFDNAVYREASEKISEGKISVSQAYAWALGGSNGSEEREGRVHFYRNLYRFHLRKEEIRWEYLKLLNLSEGLPDRLMLVRAADWIDTGCFDQAFQLLMAGLPGLSERWLKSALFQLVRLGFLSETHAAPCLEAALRLRGLH